MPPRCLPQPLSSPWPLTHPARRWVSGDGRSATKIGSVASLLDFKPPVGSSPPPTVTINGFVRSVRAQKHHCFVALGDGSSITPLQALVSADQAEGLVLGAAVRLQGNWVDSPAKGQSHELHVDQVEVLGPSDAKTFPIQKKYQTPEYLRTIPHLRSRIPFNTALLRFRSDAIASVTNFFNERQFIQTQPPIITSSDCEGAGEVFTVEAASVFAADKAQSSNEERHSSSGGGGVDTGQDQKLLHDHHQPFFRSPKYLTVSSQLHLEALAQSIGNVWTLGPTFRAERSDTSRHLAEFYMLEAEVSFVDRLDGIMDLAEDMLRHLASSLYNTKASQELRTPNKHGRPGDITPVEDVERRWLGLMEKDRWPRMTYTEAIDLLRKDAEQGSAKFTNEPLWGESLAAEHEKHIAKVVGRGETPVFVTGYPTGIKAFYMKPEVSTRGGERATAECFDLLVPDFCEIAGGSIREHRLDELVRAMRTRGMASPEVAPTSNDEGKEGGLADAAAGQLDWYVDLRRWGCPPHGGFGFGFDRLLCYLSGVQTIRDAVAFPRWVGRCDC